MQHDVIIRSVIPIVETFDRFRPKLSLSDQGELVYGFGFKQTETNFSTITRPVALDILYKQLFHLSEVIYKSIDVNVTIHQMVAMVDYAYDLGLDKFKASGIVSLINQGYSEAAKQQIMRGVYVRKNNKMLVSRSRESRRRMSCRFWDKAAA